MAEPKGQNKAITPEKEEIQNKAEKSDEEKESNSRPSAVYKYRRPEELPKFDNTPVKVGHRVKTEKKNKSKK